MGGAVQPELASHRCVTVGKPTALSGPHLPHASKAPGPLCQLPLGCESSGPARPGVCWVCCASFTDKLPLCSSFLCH